MSVLLHHMTRKRLLVNDSDPVVSDPHFTSVVLLFDWYDRGVGTDPHFSDVVLLLDTSTEE